MKNAHLKKRERWVQMSKDDLNKILKQKQRVAITSKSARTDVKLIVRMLNGRKQAELLINPTKSKQHNAQINVYQQIYNIPLTTYIKLQRN